MSLTLLNAHCDPFLSVSRPFSLLLSDPKTERILQNDMFDEFNPLTWRIADWRALTVMLLVIVLWRRYAVWCQIYEGQSKRSTANGAPPTFPYFFPLLGSLPVSYLWKPRAFVLSQE